jgi:hypothetical protein
MKQQASLIGAGLGIILVIGVGFMVWKNTNTLQTANGSNPALSPAQLQKQGQGQEYGQGAAGSQNPGSLPLPGQEALSGGQPGALPGASSATSPGTPSGDSSSSPWLANSGAPDAGNAAGATGSAGSGAGAGAATPPWLAATPATANTSPQGGTARPGTAGSAAGLAAGNAAGGNAKDADKTKALENLQQRLAALAAPGRNPSPREVDTLLAELQKQQGSNQVGGVDIGALRGNLARAEEIQRLAHELQAVAQQPGTPNTEKMQQLMSKIQQQQAGLRMDVLAPPSSLPPTSSAAPKK